MCGIVGSFGSPSDFIDQATALLNHRGPDSSGVWRDSDKAICLGHTRLSIQDLSHAGDQPMVSGCERYVIAFNGEIYNHLDLRTQLAESWIGHSDTETLLACISRWGLDKTLHEVIGMFAFALWDRQSRKLYLARDRIGEKPLYYGAIEGSLIFASELNPLKTHPGWSAEIDVNSLGLLLRYGYIPAPYSIYSGFRKVQPGTYLEITSPSAEPIIHEYWSRKEITDAHHDQLEGDPVVALEDLLRKSVTSQLIADVPYGAFLSGGIDSSTVVALMQAALDNPVNTFSIGFEDPNYDESGFARNVAHHLGTNHTDLVVKPEEALAVIPRIPQVYDEPFADSSQIPTYLVAQLASKDVKVVLSGDGGDELFGGYNRYLVGQSLKRNLSRIPLPVRKGLAKSINFLATGPLKSAVDNLRHIAPERYKVSRMSEKLEKLSRMLSQSNLQAVYRVLVSFWDDEQVLLNGGGIKTIIEDPTQWPEIPYVEQLMYLDTMTYLPGDILTKVDRATMHFGLEARVPFLDRRVIEFAAKLPINYKIRDGKGKWILRQILNRHIPTELVERPKKGFDVPIQHWLRKELRDWAEDLLDEKKILDQGLFKPEPIKQKWKQHLEGKRNWENHLWSILMFQAWYETQ